LSATRTEKIIEGPGFPFLQGYNEWIEAANKYLSPSTFTMSWNKLFQQIMAAGILPHPLRKWRSAAQIKTDGGLVCGEQRAFDLVGAGTRDATKSYYLLRE